MPWHILNFFIEPARTNKMYDICSRETPEACLEIRFFQVLIFREKCCVVMNEALCILKAMDSSNQKNFVTGEVPLLFFCHPKK